MVGDSPRSLERQRLSRIDDVGGGQPVSGSNAHDWARPGLVVNAKGLIDSWCLWPADTFVGLDHGLNAAVNVVAWIDERVVQK